jgi:hypothetical protein
MRRVDNQVLQNRQERQSPGPSVRPLFFSAASVVMFLCGLGLTGCGHLPFDFHPGGKPAYLYVISKGTYIRDRIAPVSNHVENIVNGERLTVVQHDRRFYKVKTPDGKVGWIEEHSVMDQAGYDSFQNLASRHAKDPVVATGLLRDVIFLHLTPGRKTDHFYLLPAMDHLQLLRRASVLKPLPPQALLTPHSLKPHAPRPPRLAQLSTRRQSGSTVYAEAPAHPDRYTAPDLDPSQPWMQQPMEDWWLVRDQSGRVGWLLGRSVDINVPDEVAQYSEGRRIVGAYLLNTVMDSGVPPEKHIGPKQQKRIDEQFARKAVRLRKHPEAVAAEDQTPPAPAPVPHPVGQYVTVTSEYKDGLPYDWDQVRVFIWNTSRHRYETAYRLREQQGYLPVLVGREMVDKMGEEPTFTVRTTPDGVVTQDDDGVFHPKTVQLTQYRLEGGIVRRDTPLPQKPGAAPDGFAPSARKASSPLHALPRHHQESHRPQHGR